MQTSVQPAQLPTHRSRHSRNGRKGYPCRPLSPNKAALSQTDGMRIFQTLVADDNELYRCFLRGILARHFPFMLVAEAENGDHALALDAELRPQLVFMDIKLPDRSGLDLTKQIKSSHPEVLVYLVTQYDIPEYRIAARECGADHLVVMGESSEAAIVAMVEATLNACRRTTHMEGAVEMRIHEECVPDLPG